MRFFNVSAGEQDLGGKPVRYQTVTPISNLSEYTLPFRNRVDQKCHCIKPAQVSSGRRLLVSAPPLRTMKGAKRVIHTGLYRWTETPSSETSHKPHTLCCSGSTTIFIARVLLRRQRFPRVVPIPDSMAKPSIASPISAPADCSNRCSSSGVLRLANGAMRIALIANGHATGFQPSAYRPPSPDNDSAQWTALVLT